MSEISERILEAITSKEMSYGELSKLTGIPKSALQRYATGQTEKIPIDRLEAIANALGVDVAFLMGWSEELSAAVNKQGELYSGFPPREFEVAIGTYRFYKELNTGVPASFDDIPIESREKIRKSYEFAKLVANLTERDYEILLNTAKIMDNSDNDK